VADEITSKILRQIREDMHEFRTEFRDFKNESRAFQDETRSELSILHTLLRDSVGRAITLTRIITNKVEPAINDLVKRVARLEKKVS
jgi:hypothetical protein